VSSLCAPLQCDELATFATAAAANLMTRLLCSDVIIYVISTICETTGVSVAVTATD
jgi:hypothetical protein